MPEHNDGPYRYHEAPIDHGTFRTDITHNEASFARIILLETLFLYERRAQLMRATPYSEPVTDSTLKERLAETADIDNSQEHIKNMARVFRRSLVGVLNQPEKKFTTSEQAKWISFTPEFNPNVLRVARRVDGDITRPFADITFSNPDGKKTLEATMPTVLSLIYQFEMKSFENAEREFLQNQWEMLVHAPNRPKLEQVWSTIVRVFSRSEL